jgi:trans-aconitate methyltransferase
MTGQRNPQAEQMAHESMLRNLAAQAEAIWPQESAFFARYVLPSRARIADIGCGSGEITMRLAGRYGEAELVGVDILAASTRRSGRACASSRAMPSTWRSLTTSSTWSSAGT